MLTCHEPSDMTVDGMDRQSLSSTGMSSTSQVQNASLGVGVALPESSKEADTWREH